MKRINKKITTALLAGAAMTLVTGCGGGSSATIPDDGTKDMTQQQAKDAMALNALFYPVLVPLQSCLADIKQCATDMFNPSVAMGWAITTDQMAPGEHNCTVGDATKGKYTVDSNDGNKLVVRFDTDPANPGCYDVDNAQDIEGALIGTCINTILGTNIGNPGTADTDGTSTYKVQYEGKVTCTKATSAILENYVVSAFGQTDPNNNPNRHSYNMTVSMTNGLMIDGTYHAEKWAPSSSPTDPKINDETWIFRKLNLASGRTVNGLSIVADGGASYVGTVREGDEGNNGMKLAIDFTNLTYAMTGSLSNTDVTVSGGVSASCHPDVVTYTTPGILNDLNNVRDAAANRMPNSGKMNIGLSGYKAASAEFSAPGTAQLSITASDGAKIYDSWRAITTTSSCASLQKIIDRIIPPNKPISSIEISENCSLDEGSLINDTNPLELKVLESKCINAFATYTDGTRGRVTTSVFWTSSDRSIATMPLLQTSSKVTGRSEGNTTVKATLYGVTASAPVKVSKRTP